MKRALCCTTLVGLLLSGNVLAHFQEIIPSNDVLSQAGPITLDLTFTHPMEGGPILDMARPVRFGVKRGNTVVDLNSRLEERSRDGHRSWFAKDEIKEPGASIYFVETQPYWEGTEGKYVVQYAKVMVDGYASGKNWRTLVGLPVEIEPLTRPVGLWAGNLFTGIVRRNGQPVPNADIEIQYLNDGTLTIPSPVFTTQVLRADPQGVFSYAMPRAGWWGFAAIVEGKPQPRPDGGTAPVELGGVIWVKTTDMK